jgi:hypothetical protein
LILAETLERAGRPEEAILAYAEIVRRALAGRPLDRTRGAATLARWLPARACRGLARCQLAARRAELAWNALAAAEWLEWRADLGTDRARLLVAGSGVDERSRAALDAALDRARAAAPEFQGVPAIALDAALRKSEGRAAARVAAGPPVELASPARYPGGGQAMLAFTAVGPESLVGWLIRPGSGPVVRIVPARRSDLLEAARRWRAGLGDGGRPGPVGKPGLPDRLAGPLPEPDFPPGELELDVRTDPARFLAGALLAPFRAELAGLPAVALYPGEPLGSTPIEPLAAGTLGDELPEFRLVASLLPIGDSPEPTRAPGVVAVGIDHAEAIVLGRIARESGVALDQVEMEEALANGSGILHIKAQLDFSPTSSRVVGILPRFGADGSETSTLGDLSRLRLRGQLVVLDLRAAPGQDLVPPMAWRELARTWISAGAGGVVLNLWEMPEGASLPLLAALHRGLAAGLRPDAALRRARDQLRADPRWVDPVDWAGLVHYGPLGVGSDGSGE